MKYLDLIKSLYGLTETEGCTEEEIAAMKARFGALPEVLEDFYHTAAKTYAFQRGQDTWILPEDYNKWAWLDNREALILLNENQGVCQAGILRENLEKEDPPVYVTYDDGGSWRLCAGSTTEFLGAALAYEAAFTFEYEPEAFYWYTPEEVKKVKAGMKKLPFELLDWCSEMHVTLYQNAPDNLLALMTFEDEDEDGEVSRGNEPQALYGAVTEESYGKLLTVLDGLGEPV